MGALAAPECDRIVAALDLAGSVTVLRGSETRRRFARSLAQRVADAWPLDALETDYRQFVARFAGVTGALRDLRDARDPEQSFVVRTLLVHAYRRVRLRDPQLPSALLPRGWPGADAYALCRDFYRLAQPLAEAHITAVARASGERLAASSATFRSRFRRR
jgi:phenylacetic acid degradation operon negative regulatory protein